MINQIAAALKKLQSNYKSLLERVEAVEKVEPVVIKGIDGKDGESPDISEVVEAVLASIEIPKPEKVDVNAIINEVVAKIPQPAAGRDAPPVNVSDVAAIVLAKMPKPKDGEDGKSPDINAIVKKVKLLVKDGRDGESGVNGRDGKDGKDGVSVTDVKLTDNSLFVWLDGRKKKAGDIKIPTPVIAGAGGGGGRRPWYAKEIVVTEAAQLSGSLRSDVIYYLDGVIDFTGTGYSITIPEGGLDIKGHSFDVSGIKCSDDNFTLFNSPVGGSGTMFNRGYYIEVTGANSKVFDITDKTGNDAIEFFGINFNGCTSLGEINGYRQVIEENVGRFGGTPELTLSGAWAGGYRAFASIVRGIDDAMNAPLFKAGAGFVMQGRFLTDINVNLGATASLFDFSPSNFPVPSSLEVIGATVQRNGIFSADDLTITPNITASSLSSAWANNVGIDNTYVGGRVTVSSEVETVINTTGQFVDLLGVFADDDLVHFENGTNSQLKHLGNAPRNYRIDVDAIIDGVSGVELELKVVRWDNSASTFVDVGSQVRVVNNLQGGRDVAFFNETMTAVLDVDDFVKLQIANLTNATNATAEIGTFMMVSER